MMRRIMAFAALIALPLQPLLAQACQADRPPPFDTLIRLAIPPQPGNRSFTGYPATGFAAQLYGPSGPRFRQFMQPESASRQDRFVFRWVNRCHNFLSDAVRSAGDGPTGAYRAATESARKCRSHRGRDGQPKGNYPEIAIAAGRDRPAGTYRFLFSTVARADSCTMAQVLVNFGAMERANQILRDAGLVRLDMSRGADTPISDAAHERALPTIAARASYDPYGGARANGRPVFDPAPYRTARAFLDVCLTEYARGLETHLDGVVFDWEVVDDRSIAEGAELARRIDRTLHRTAAGEPLICAGATECRPRQAILATHSFDDPDGNDSFTAAGARRDYVRRSSISRDGLGSGNAAVLRRSFDLIGISLSSNTRSRNRRLAPQSAEPGETVLDSEILASLNEQERVLGVTRGDRRGLMVAIGMGSLEPDDARFLRRELDRRGYRDVMISNVIQRGDRLQDCDGRFHRNLRAFLAD